MNTVSVRRLIGPVVALALLGGVWILSPTHGEAAIGVIGMSLKEMLLVIPPVFILLGLLDVWVSRERLMRHMGGAAGARGTIIAFLMGSVAAGPLYAAFPVGVVLMRKGASLFNVMVFIGAWSTTKVPMFLFEYAALGSWFAVTRLAANIPAILIMSAIIAKIIPAHEYEALGQQD
ncbi:MAG: permease [Spirochaeta sp.]|nr:permease [Spirochaeta sp.]